MILVVLGFGLGSVEGRVAIHYIQPQSSKDNFTFKCHRQNNAGTMNVQDIYAVRMYIIKIIYFSNLLNCIIRLTTSSSIRYTVH